MNFRAILLPDTRADRDDYWLGLGLIALVDAVRLSLTGPSGGFGFLIILFFLTSLHINRLRDAGRPRALALVAIAGGLVAKMAVSFIAMAVALMPYFFAYLESQGVNVDDPEALRAASQDPEVMEGVQAYIREREAEVLAAVAEAADWPALVGFWAAVGGLGLWYARMPRAGGPRAGRPVANDRR